MEILKFEILIVRVLVSVPTPLAGEFEAEPQAIRTHTSHMYTDTHCRVHTCTQTDFYKCALTAHLQMDALHL